MPVSDGLFPQLPAEQDGLAVHFTREIKQADVEVLDLHPDSVDFSHRVLDPLDGLFPFGLAARQSYHIDRHSSARKILCATAWSSASTDSISSFPSIEVRNKDSSTGRRSWASS